MIVILPDKNLDVYIWINYDFRLNSKDLSKSARYFSGHFPVAEVKVKIVIRGGGGYGLREEDETRI